MTVTVSKPALNLREELSALKKISGIKGEELLRANTVDDVYASLNPTMFRNRLINGDMRIWQRGITTTPGSGFSVDMFRCEPRNGTTIYTDRSTDVPAGQGFTYSMRTYATGATDEGFHIRTYVELPATGVYGEFQPGTQWTVSFWMKSAYASRTINATLTLAETSVGGSNQSDSVASSQGTQFVTNQWKKYVFNFTLPAWVAGVGSLSNVRCLSVRLIQGSDDLPQDTYLTGLQLERGAVATPFEVRPIGTELALCQRYCTKFGGGSTNDAFGSGFAAGTSSYHFVPLPVPMRGTPTLILYGTASDINVTTVAVAAACNGTPTVIGTGVSSTVLQAGHGTSITSGYAVYIRSTSSSTFIILTAEL